MWYCICIFIGLVFGFASASIIFLARGCEGTLRIDHSSSEKDIYRFEINDLDKISEKKSIVLKIDNSANLSRK